ncbi:putative adipose-regulatory protein-domain-containing protein [Chaetomium fimeti]|uniref:Adipose-regulatory protein-domain-containing protein n=1 Tax=Chaetomium fimeti TaxID=1854472 RepID=A0AAE0HA89_9PEZI|nr:putative adipose-regulatory protein-domain-containing protein [Chaetomium fimeti]
MLALHLLSPSGTASDAIPITTPKTIPYLLPARPLSDSSAQEPPSSSSSSSSWHSLDALLQPTRLDLPSFLASHTIVHTTARPALIPYVDPLASLASRVLFLGYHLLAPRGAAAVRLTVPMAEGLAFAVPRRDAARVLPDSLLLEVQAGQAIQVYDARVTLVARLRGLQGFMYRWRVTAFVLFTAAFWMTEMVVMAVVLVVVGVKLGGRGEEGDGEEGKEGKDGGEDGNGASGDAGDAGDTGGYGDTDEYGDNGDQSGGSEDDEKGDLGTEVAKDRERRIKAEGSLSSAPETRTVKKEEEGARSMADVPSYPTGSSTEAGDEDEGKREEGPESKDTGTRSSSSQVTEGVARRRFLLSREDNSVSGD